MGNESRKFHITDSGDVRTCNARVRACKYGESVHYTDRNMARAAVEARYVDEHPEQVMTKRLKLTAREKELREKNAQLASQIVQMRAASTDGVIFDDANPERAKKRLLESVEYAKSRQNHNLVHKLVKSKVLPSGAFKTKDGKRVNTDKYLKQYTAIKHIDAERENLINAFRELVDNDDRKEDKYSLSKVPGVGTLSVTFSHGKDDKAIKALPEKVLEAISSDKEYLNVDLAREHLTPEEFAAVTSESQVLDVVLGKRPDVGQKVLKANTEFVGESTDDKINDGLRKTASFYKSVKDAYGHLGELKKDAAESNDAIKAVAGTKNQYTFAPARSQFNGALVTNRRNVSLAKAKELLTPEQLSLITATRKEVDPEKAAKVLTPQQFGKMFNAPIASLRFTEEKKK